ncbi:MAG: endonuclease III [Bacteroidetes bacterium]|nr:endonuclease III [Bacteroidota bacterium]
MQQKETLMKSTLIKRINALLVKKFGFPKRNGLPNPLDLLIATILSQNTNDNNSYKAFQNLKSHYKSWDELLDEKRSVIKSRIRVAGLAEQKSAAIKNLITELHKKNDLSLKSIERLENEHAIEQLTSHKGIGVKTASCVLLFALDRNVCPVDTHVHRTTNRIGIVKEKTPDKTFFALNQNFPEGIAHSFHTNLIRLGREICKSTNPSCGICPLLKICNFPDKNLNGKTTGKKREFMLLDNVNLKSER